MTLYVDRAVWRWQGRRWAHLVSDTGPEELHLGANAVGKPRVSYQGDHYDLHEEQRARALELGAVAVDSREIVRILRRTGQRLLPTERGSGWRWFHDEPASFAVREAAGTLRRSAPEWMVDMVDRALASGFDEGERVSLAGLTNGTVSVALIRGAIPAGGPGPAHGVTRAVGAPVAECWATLTDEGPLLELLTNRPVTVGRR